MNRRGFLKMLGLAVPAAVVAPLAVAEVGRGSSYPGMPQAIDQTAAWENAGIAIQSIFPVGGR